MFCYVLQCVCYAVLWFAMFCYVFAMFCYVFAMFCQPQERIKKKLFKNFFKQFSASPSRFRAPQAGYI